MSNEFKTEPGDLPPSDEAGDDMHIHKPKATHSLREFLSELAVIVLGVLIALGFEAVAEGIRWRAEVSEARHELRYELGLNLELARGEVRQGECVDRRLDQLGAILATASRTRQLPAIGNIGAPNSPMYPTGVWEAQISGQRAAHMPQNELASIARVYKVIGTDTAWIEREKSAWLALDSLTGPGRPLDAYTEGRLYQALVEARAATQVHKSQMAHILGILKQSELGEGYAELDPKHPPIRMNSTPICEPIGSDIPAVYGK